MIEKAVLLKGRAGIGFRVPRSQCREYHKLAGYLSCPSSPPICPGDCCSEVDRGGFSAACWSVPAVLCKFCQAGNLSACSLQALHEAQQVRSKMLLQLAVFTVTCEWPLRGTAKWNLQHL